MNELDKAFDEDAISEEEREELGEPTPAKKQACPTCGKLLTWISDGSRPRKHKCIPAQSLFTPPTEVEPIQEVPATTGISVAAVVGVFIKTRDELVTRKKAFEADILPLRQVQEARENWLLGKLAESGLQSMRTEVGTCFVDWKDSATVADRETLFVWIQTEWEQRKEFLTNSISKTAVKQMLADEGEAPPGVKYSRFKSVKIRRV